MFFKKNDADKIKEAEAAVARGMKFVEKGEFDKADREYKKALKIKPDYPPVLQARSALYLAMEKDEPSRKYKELGLSDANPAENFEKDIHSESALSQEEIDVLLGGPGISPEKTPPVSIYSDITDEALEVLHSQFTEKYGKALNDEEKKPEERSLEVLVKKAVSPEKVDDEIHAVQEFVKEYVCRQLKELALIIYVAMRKRNDYGGMGEQRVSISFMRNILGIPNNQEVNQFDAFKFIRIIDKCDERHGGKSGDEYIEFIKNWSFVLFNKTYLSGSFSDLIPLFGLIKAPYSIHRTHGPYQTQFIFAECETMEYDKYTAYMFRREYIRSPDRTLSTAAQTMDNGMMIRRESIEVISFNKYQNYLWQYDIDKRYRAKAHPNVMIQDFYKRQVFLRFGIDPDSTVLSDRKRKYENIRDTMTAEIEDGVLWNQVGGLAYKENLAPVYEAFKSCLVNYDDGIGNNYGIVLSDWFPVKGKYQGAISRFCEISEFDIVRATRDLYMYLSDYWFSDENDFMPRATTVCTGLLIPFLNDDLSFDFAGLKKEMPFIYTLAFTRMTALFEKLIAIIKRSRYQMHLYNMGVAELEETVYRMYQDSRNARSLEELRKFGPFWINMHGYLQKFSTAGYEEFEALLAFESLEFESIILGHFTGTEVARYHNSLREYIYTRLLDLGFVPREREKDVFNFIEKVRDSDEYTLAYNNGVICHLNGEDEKAFEYLNAAIEIMPTAKAFYKRGLVNRALKNTEAAISDLEDASFICGSGQGEDNSLLTLCNIELGDLYVESNEIHDAIMHYSDAIGLKPRNIDILLKRGDAYAAAGDYAVAIDDYTEIIKTNAKVNDAGVIEAYKKRGVAYEKSGRMEEAAKDNALAYYYKGYALYGLKDYKNAIEEFLKALSFQNDFDDALLNLALSYHNLQEYEKAIDVYGKVIENNPKNYYAWTNRGILYRVTNDFEATLDCFNRAIELRPDIPSAFEERGRLYLGQKKFKEAVDDFSSAINIKPNAGLYYNRGLAYANLQDRENAIKDYTVAIKNKPDYLDAYLQRGHVYYNQGRYDEAIADYTRMAELSPDDYRSYYYRGLLYDHRLDHRKAIEYYSLAIEKYPECFDAWVGRARCKEFIGLEGCISDCEEAVHLNPQSSNAFFVMGNIYNSRRYCDYEKAIQAYSNVLELAPESFNAQRLRGDCYTKLKQYDNAINDYRGVIILIFAMVNRDGHANIMQKGRETFSAGEYDDALGFFQQTLKDDPGNPLVVYNCSLALIMLNRHDEAVSLLAGMEGFDFLQERTDARTCISGILTAAALKNIDELTLFLEKNPADVDIYLKRGEAYQWLFEPGSFHRPGLPVEYEPLYAAATENYIVATKIQPGNERIWFGLGKFLDNYSVLFTEYFDSKAETMQYLNQAVENYTKALQLNPNFIDALESRAKAYQKLGLDEKAEADLAAAIEASKK